MRTRTLILGTVLLIVFLAAANFFSDYATLLSRLPDSDMHMARQEALQKPFLERSHRLERRARLERTSIKLEESTEKPEKKELGSTTTSQRLQKSNLETAEKEQQRAKYHVVSTVDGALYTEWQVRVSYYSYLKAKERYPNSAMGGFTRLLHSGKADNLTAEIPTTVVQPLPSGSDEGYAPLNRPFAFAQWVRDYLPTIPEDYILMTEPDHIFVQPLPLWATPSKAIAYPFLYVTPKAHTEVVNKYNDKGISAADMPQTGSSPVQIHKRQMEGIVDLWYNTSMRMRKDPDARKAFGWILEMYSFSVASSQVEGGPVAFELHPELMAQPPFDPDLNVSGKSIYIIHLTYGMNYDSTGKQISNHGDLFHFDKRDYVAEYPPRNLTLPPKTIRAPVIDYFLSAINEASNNLPWPR